MHTAVREPAPPARGAELPGPTPARVARPRGRSTPGGGRSIAPRRRAATRRVRVRWRRVALLALLVVAAGALLVAGGATAGTEPAGPRTVVVGERETAWDLVRPYVPEGTDHAVYVAEVVAANEVDPLRLAPGTVLRLP